MRKTVFTFTLLLATLAGMSQAKKTSSKPVANKSAQAPAPVMKNIVDSVSYAIGMSLASFYKEQGITKINTSLVTKGLNDAMKGQKTLLTEEQMNMSISNYLQQLKKEKSAAARKTGEAF